MTDSTESLSAPADSWETLQPRLQQLESQLRRLLLSTAFKFDSGLRGVLPEAQGIYRIFRAAQPGETIRAGRTKTAAGGLRQRVYQNHFMGDQKGNLRAQLAADLVCADIKAAKMFIRENLVVQVLVVENSEERTWLEHFMLAVLRPRFCD